MCISGIVHPSAVLKIYFLSVAHPEYCKIRVYDQIVQGKRTFISVGNTVRIQSVRYICSDLDLTLSPFIVI